MTSECTRNTAYRRLRLLSTAFDDAEAGRFIEYFRPAGIDSASVLVTPVEVAWSNDMPSSQRMMLHRHESRWIKRLQRSSEIRRLGFDCEAQHFGAFDLRELIAAQPFVYEDKLALRQNSNLNEVVRIALPPLVEIDEPSELTRDAISFESPDAFPAVLMPLGFRRYIGSACLIAPMVAPPNFMRVVETPRGFMITNGHHRAIALLRQGIHRVVCFVAREADLLTLCSRNGFMQYEKIQRVCPRLLDFVNDARTFSIDVPRATYTTRIQLIVERRRSV